VFARPEYEWIERRHIVLLASLRWQHLMTGWTGFPNNIRLSFNLVLALSALALLVLLVHIGYVVLRIVRPTVRTGTTTSAVTGGKIMDAAAHLALAEQLARGVATPKLWRTGSWRSCSSSTPESAALPCVQDAGGVHR
jgi:hypothetical protein